MDVMRDMHSHLQVMNHVLAAWHNASAVAADSGPGVGRSAE